MPPTVDVHTSFLNAMAEFIAEGYGGGYVNPGPQWPDLQAHTLNWHTAGGFTEFVTWLQHQALPQTTRPASRVPWTDLWWVAGRHYLGRLSIRHQLTDALRAEGGHIGYDVRPSARRLGHATAMLAAGCPIAHQLGIDPAILTCAPDNLPSRKVIERNNGVIVDQLGNRLRFEVPTSSRWEPRTR